MKRKGYMEKMGVSANIVNVADASRLMGSLISGESDLSTSAGFAQVLPAIEKGGKLKILASAGAVRARFQPDIATLAEQGIPNVEQQGYFMFLAPRGTVSACVIAS